MSASEMVSGEARKSKPLNDCGTAEKVGNSDRGMA